MTTLKELYDGEKTQEKVLLDAVNAENESSILNFLWMKNQVFGTYEITQKNIPAAKAYFYNCGRLDMMKVMKYNDRLFDYGLTRVYTMLLSDSPWLIDKYAELRYVKTARNPWDMETLVAKGEPSIWCHTIFMVIKENQELLARNLDLIENKAIKGKNMSLMKYDFEFLKAMYEKNEKAIENALNQLVDPVFIKKRDDDAVIRQHLSFPAAGYAKLAWLKGIQVEVNSPLVPKELLIVDPLKEYKDNYRFVEQYLQDNR